MQLQGSPNPPRVRGLPLVGSALGLLKNPLTFMERITRDHGDVVEFGLLNERVILFNHPDAIDELLIGQKDKLIKDSLTRDLSMLLGQGLLVSEGTFWRRQRKLAQPAFHRQRIEAYGDVMVRFTERAIAQWRDGQKRNLHEDMMRLTLDIVAETLFGVEDISAVARKIEWALQVLMERFTGLGHFVPLGIPTPMNLRSRKAIEELDTIIYRIIAERRRSGDDRGDLLSMLLAATSEDEGHKMTDKQLRDESITLLLAGHETTALTLTYCFHLLGQHPHVADQLAAEITSVLGDRPATAADLPKLKMADAVVRESMRLYPPAWAVGREAIEPCKVAGIDIPVGTQLWAAQWIVHRDARWFPEPLAFKPERWANDFAKTLPKHAYFPFGGGPRVCIGNAFAMMEAVLLLVTIVRSHSLRALSKGPIETIPSVTLRPKNGLFMTVERRKRP